MPGADGGEFTIEGPIAVKKAIEFLKSVKPVQPLGWSDEMAKACRDHVNDTGPKGTVGHDGSDGSTFVQRLDRYGNASGH